VYQLAGFVDSTPGLLDGCPSGPAFRSAKRLTAPPCVTRKIAPVGNCRPGIAFVSKRPA
jgi:hypothetical protein